jgi:alpha-glucuronidase
MQSNMTGRPSPAEVVRFDDALLKACGPKMHRELMAEATMLAEAFAPEGRAAQIEAMAETLSVDARDEASDRAHALRLAAALRCLARDTGS